MNIRFNLQARNLRAIPRLVVTLCCTVGLIFALLLAAPAAHAQFRASIQGVVADQQGAVIPGAAVTLSNLGTNQVLKTTSNNDGLYTFNALAPDKYSLTVEKDGFSKKVFDSIQITPEQANTVNVEMEVGGSSQTVTVSSDQTPGIETATASISGTIDSNEVQHLPSFGRDVFQLTQLAPGVFGDGSQGSGGGTNNLPGTQIGGPSSTDGIFKTENGPQVIANGQQNNANGISIDGISTASAVWGGTSVITPSEDSIADLKVVSNGYDAENGRFSAGQLQVISKSGTNDVHGSLFFKADRPGLNAYQAWNGPNSVGPGTAADRGLLRDESRFNQYGGSLGGPLWKNKVFAFFNYETLRNDTSSTATGWYDTPDFDALAPAGSIAAEFLTFPGAQPSAIGQISVSCKDAGLTENVNCRTIPGKGLNIGSPLTGPLGKQDLTWQSNGMPGVGSGLSDVADIAEYTTAVPDNVVEEQYNGRADANISAKDKLSFTIYWVPQSTTSYNGPARAYNLYHHSQINDAFTGLWNHVFSPTLLNEARVNAAGWRWNEIASNPQEPFGLPTNTISQIGDLNGSSGNTTFNTFGPPGPSVFDQWTYGYQDVATKVWRNHNIKFGGGLTRLSYLNEAPYNARPAFGFYNVWDFLNDAPDTESGTFNPLTGTPTANREDQRENIWGFFIQDDWKATPNLTFNLGLRYSYYGSLSSKQGNLSVAELGIGAAQLTDLHMRIGGNLYNPQKGNLGPQFGFAYTPPVAHGKMVVRGGFGVNYDEEEIAIAANGINNPPNVVAPNFSSGSPKNINPGIVYQVPSDVHSLFGYPANPNTIVSYGANNLPTTGSVFVTAFPANLSTPIVYHYSLDTQVDLGAHIIATAGYQGSVGHHLIAQYNANVLAGVQGIALNPSANFIDTYANQGVSSYHSALVTVKHDFSHGFLMDVEYSWSKSMDTGSQPYYEDPYPYNSALAWGRSDYNVGSAFKAYGLWQPVLFHGNHGILEKVAGGWSLSGILNLHTGFPWTPEYNNITNGNLYYQGSGYGSLRPAAYKGGAGHDTSNSAFESGGNNKNYSQGALSYFTIPAYTPVDSTVPFPEVTGPPQAPGVSRNSLDGPNYRDVDATLSKAFGLPHIKGLGEAARFEVRVDAFNLFNTVNLNVASISSAISNDGITSNSSFGQAQSALGSRTLDLQARFSF